MVFFVFDVISLSRANQSQAKFKSAVGGNLLQIWVNLTIVLGLPAGGLNRCHGLRAPQV